MVLTKDNLEYVSKFVDRSFYDATIIHEKLNNVGSKNSMQDLDELLIYSELLKEFTLNWDFNNNDEPNLLSSKDIFNIHNRVIYLNQTIRQNVI